MNTNENISQGEGPSEYFKCRSCGKEFDSFGDMQKHIMTEHMQKGDIPQLREEEEGEEGEK